MRIMGLDYGSVTVGVAISDPLLITAQGIEVIRRKHHCDGNCGEIIDRRLYLLEIVFAISKTIY